MIYKLCPELNVTELYSGVSKGLLAPALSHTLEDLGDVSLGSERHGFEFREASRQANSRDLLPLCFDD